MSVNRLEKVTLKLKVLRVLWIITYFIFFRPFGTRFFRRWRLFILKLWGAKVKKSSSVYANVKIWAPWNLILEENAGIGPHSIIYNQDLIYIGKNSKVSQYCYLCTAGHDITELNNSSTGLITGPIIIKANAWIGTNSFINMNIEIGEGSVIAASSNVVSNVEPWTIVGGNPARFIKKRVLEN